MHHDHGTISLCFRWGLVEWKRKQRGGASFIRLKEISAVVLSLAKNPMIGAGRMGNIRTRITRHMAIDATVRRRLLQAFAQREAATVLLVTAQAGLSVMSHALLGRRTLVRIVAGNAANLVLLVAALETAALVHLLDMADRFLLTRFRCANEHRPKQFQRQSRAIVIQASTATGDTSITTKMTLLADRLTQAPVEMTRIDDRVIDGRSI